MEAAIAPRECEASVFDTIILGAGISGLVTASILSEKSDRKILVCDEYGHLGGNHIDWSSKGYTFDVGSLIFQDDSPLLRHFPELLPLYVPIQPSWGRLNPQRRVTAYPISVQDDILRDGPSVISRIFGSVIYARLFRRKMQNAEDFARFWIGSYLFKRSGLKTYMTRFYGLDPSEIDIELAQKRMLWISENASFSNLLRRFLSRGQEQAAPNRQMARPREGFAALYRAAEDRLRRRGVEFRLGQQLISLSATGSDEDREFVLETADGHLRTRRIVSTIPLNRAQQLCGIRPERELKSITLIALYFSFAGVRGFDQSILYNFSDKGAWKRLTVYSDFYGKVGGREYFAVEVVSNFLDGTTQDAERDFRSHVRENGLFEGDLQLEGSQKLENAYPIYSKGAAKEAEAAINRLDEFGLHSLGRQGAFNYQPTARATTIEAEAVIQARWNSVYL